MSKTCTSSVNLELERGDGDRDLTPKPLRIVKRGAIGEPGFCKTLSTKPISIPIRRSSRSNSKSWPTPLGEQSLCVQKQRPRDPSYRTERSSVVKTSLPFGPQHHTSDPIRSADQRCNEGSGARIMPNVIPKFPHFRAFTVSHEPLPPAITQRKSQRRRAVTDGETKPRQSNVVITDDGSVLGRNPSSTRGFINRVNAGLSQKAQPKAGTTLDLIGKPRLPGSDGLNNYSLSVCQEVDSQSRIQKRHAETDCRTKRTSSSTQETKMSKDSVSKYLDAFPTPPTSNTSPTTSISFGELQSRPGRVRELRMPQVTAIMGAELTITPEMDRVCPDPRGTMLVAIDIKGTMEHPPTDTDSWSQYTGLDVVVIIDNSYVYHRIPILVIC